MKNYKHIEDTFRTIHSIAWGLSVYNMQPDPHRTDI